MKTSQKLAIEGGEPVRTKRLPYGRQQIDKDDIDAVVGVLKSDLLTTGPRVQEFEREFARTTGAAHAVAVSSGTAGLHAALNAVRLKPGDEVIVPSMTFLATANCVVFEGGTPKFADVRADTLLLDSTHLRSRITSRTRAIISVDYAGQPCEYDSLKRLEDEFGVVLIADACHALGAQYQGRRVGTLAALNVFSLHPVKQITTGEGGCITTDNKEYADRMKAFRNHGMSSDYQSRENRSSWVYEMHAPGYNYRLTDIQCALGISQLRKLQVWIERRRAIAGMYDRALSEISAVQPLSRRADVAHAYHLYVVLLDLEKLRVGREQIFSALHAENIGVNVHYIPVHLQPFYREKFNTKSGDCPNAESCYERLLTLPLFPAMTDRDVKDVIEALHKVIAHYLLT